MADRKPPLEPDFLDPPDELNAFVRERGFYPTDLGKLVEYLGRRDHVDQRSVFQEAVRKRQRRT